VFAGRPGEAPYEADAATGPTNLYGQTKLDGEAAVLGETRPGWGAVMRVPVLYGSVAADKGNGESAVNCLMDVVMKSQDQGGKKVKMDHWALRYPTNTEDVGRVCYGEFSCWACLTFVWVCVWLDMVWLTDWLACVDVAVRYLGEADKASLPRVLQFSSEDKYTKYEMCQLFGEIMGVAIDGIEANTEGNDPKASVQRPYDCHLSTKALKELGIDVSTQDFVGWWRRECRAFRH
jgi:dTDP-4-dehydrorhamnose reductase